jgi:hypothetical protein
VSSDSFVFISAGTENPTITIDNVKHAAYATNANNANLAGHSTSAFLYTENEDGGGNQCPIATKFGEINASIGGI